jgi:hypothetical protein
MGSSAILGEAVNHVAVTSDHHGWWNQLPRRGGANDDPRECGVPAASREVGVQEQCALSLVDILRRIL